MRVRIEPKSLQGHFRVVSSKSLSHRYVLGAALSKGESILENVLDSDDLDATITALKAFGVDIELPMIKGGLRQAPKVIDAKESGSTLRFLIPIAALFSSAVTFTGRNRLPFRPLDTYETLAKSHGFTMKKMLEDTYLPLEVKGRIQGGIFHIDGHVSSQFITGLLFALPLVNEASHIVLDTPLESKGYVDLTQQVLKDFQVIVEETAKGYYIKGNQVYHPVKKEIEGDYSQAAFFIVAALIGKYPLYIQGLKQDSLQGDRAILDIVNRMGGRFEFIRDELVVYPSVTKGTVINLMHIPDLGPILMVLAALSEGKTTFIHVSRLRLKESDRLDAMYQSLTKLGIQMEITGDQAVIYGKSEFQQGSYETFKDHRIVMALSVAAIRANGPVILSDGEYIQKSYPDFFKVFKQLGGIVDEVK